MAKENQAQVVLTARALHIHIADTVLVDNQDLILRDGDRVGLVGRNGAGKSTLLKVLSGIDSFYVGELSVPRTLRTRYLPQEASLNPADTVRDSILGGADDVRDLVDRYHASIPGTPEAAQLETRITACGGWQIETRLDIVHTGLGCPPLDRPIHTLSGGEIRRVALARVLLAQPDLLFLDEPTNHLDTETIEWLENTLRRYSGTCLLVTHDRRFLDRVTTRMIELSQGVLTSYSGSYRDFLRQKASREALAEADEQRRLGFLRREIDWIRRAPKARGTKSQSRVQRFEQAAGQGPLQRERDVELVIPPAPPLAKRVVTMEHVTMVRQDRTLFSDLSLDLQPGDRIGVVGPNGAGKTTLLRIMLGELAPTAGRVLVGPRTEFNYADQNRCILDDNKTVFEEIGEGNDFVTLGERTINLWAYLKRFLFTDDEIHTPVSQLSGGERSRLVLAKLLTRGGNVILLDEPTNDLDLSTLRILEEALTDFRGCVVVVSHDRMFLNRVCTGILAFEEHGALHYQPGNYDYYIEKRDSARRETLREDRPRPQQMRTAPDKPAAKLTWKQERELETLEEKIPKAEERVHELETLFSSPTFFEDHGADVKELTAELDQARHDVERLYARWTELEELRESLRHD